MTQETKTVGGWLNEWLETYIRPCKKENTYQCYKYIIIMLCKIRPQLNSMSISDAEEFFLQKILNDAAKKYSKSTIAKMRIVLKNAFDRAVHNHLCDSNPALYLNVPEATVKEVRALTPDEEETVIKAAKKDALGHIVIFLLDTGLRACEIKNLKWTDFNSQEKEIYIRKSKSKAGIRTVPLLTEAYNIIMSLPHYCDYIFTSTKKRPLTKTVLRKLYDRIRKATGIKIVTNHVYRHSFATRMMEKKASYKAISEILGHKDIHFTMNTYTDTNTKYLHEQVSVLEKKPKRKTMKFKLHHRQVQ